MGPTVLTTMACGIGMVITLSNPVVTFVSLHVLSITKVVLYLLSDVLSES